MVWMVTPPSLRLWKIVVCSILSDWTGDMTLFLCYLLFNPVSVLYDNAINKSSNFINYVCVFDINI